MLAVSQAMPSAAVHPSSDSAVPESEVTALTRRLVAADDAAWSEAHARYAPRLFRYLLVAARGDELAARDALQGAFVRAVRHARVFFTEEAFWGWLTLLARHTLADARRSTSRWRAFLDRFREAPASKESNTRSDPLSDRLGEALSRLPDADRVLLEQKYFDAATVRDLAAAANTSEKAIESRLARARARLRTILLEPHRS